MKYCAHTGGELPANLYNDNRGRPGIYRYRTPSGAFQRIEGGYKRAVELARRANEQRHTVPAARHSLAYWIREFVEFSQTNDPGLEDRTSWRQRLGYLRDFGERFDRIPTPAITVGELSAWWHSLKYDQQHNRRAVFSRLFVYMLGHGVATCNPFTSSDHEARLIDKPKPKKSRLPLHLPEFWAIYEHAEQSIRDAMVLSLLTTLRRGDIVRLRFDDIVDGCLQVTIGKSVGQRGFARASHLRWNLDEHEALRATIAAARERSLQLRRCPFIVAHKPARVRERAGAAHPYETTLEHLSRGFAAARDASGLFAILQPGRQPPSFHEIRGLAIERMIAAGADVREVQHLAAHTDERITSGYAANHAPEFIAVRLASPVQLPA